MTQRTRFLLLAALSTGLGATLGGCDNPPPPAVVATSAPNSAAIPSGTAGKAKVSDVDVNEHVKTALLQSPVLKGTDITVETSQGDVRLHGVLDSQAQIDEAVKIARAADGAHNVRDELTIRK